MFQTVTTVLLVASLAMFCWAIPSLVIAVRRANHEPGQRRTLIIQLYLGIWWTLFALYKLAERLPSEGMRMIADVLFPAGWIAVSLLLLRELRRAPASTGKA